MKEVQIESKELLTLFKAIKMLKYLTAEELNAFIALSDILEYSKDEKIISEGEISSYLYNVLEGSIRVVVQQQDEGKIKDIYIGTIGEGEIFGEAAILLNMKRTADVLSNDSIKVARIERSKFFSFIKKYPLAGIKILMYINYSLLNKLKEVNHELAFERKAYVDQQDIDNFVNNFDDIPLV